MQRDFNMIEPLAKRNIETIIDFAKNNRKNHQKAREKIERYILVLEPENEEIQNEYRNLASQYIKLRWR